MPRGGSKKGTRPRNGGARPGSGRSAFDPTPEQRRVVEQGTAFGLTIKQIASLVINPETNAPISPTTLIEKFRLELDQGQPKAVLAVARSLFQNATKNNNVSAQIFYLKAQGRWRERIDVTVRHPEDMTDEELDAAIVAAAVHDGSTAEDRTLWPVAPTGESSTRH